MKQFLSIAFLFGVVLLGHGAGKQLTGVYTPAQTPALPPAEAQKKFTVPPGFEVRLFAAEPDVVNPVAMTWDDRGRLWVVELYEYPLGAAPGRKGRDRVKILEDVDGDGRADRSKVFVDGLNLASGILIGHGGVFVGQTPNLLFFEDTNGDDIADKRTVLLTGFGRQDTHELLNSFTWGPDGYLYMTQGVFTQSKAKNPMDPADDGVYLDGGVARYHPRTKKFEVFADGTSNPWGVDFDRHGNAFVSACVIDHLFHLSPGGLYARQAASPLNPYGYELLPSIVDHKHFRAAYAGIQIYQGDHFPEEYRGTVFMGNIHGSQINHDALTPVRSSFAAKAKPDFLNANDGWFRPVSQQIGADGALWIMDWYDKYPCYQNANADPEGVDRTHGRIWRVVHTGNRPGAPVSTKPKGGPLSKRSTKDLVEMLDHPNIWQRKMAQRLLSERNDPAAARLLVTQLEKSKTVEGRLFALWTLFSTGNLTDDVLDRASKLDAPFRMWAARLTGESKNPSREALDRLEKLAEDPDPSVRVAVAVACRQFASGQLTVNRPTSMPEPEDTFDVLRILMKTPGEPDPLLAFSTWMALEPSFARNPATFFTWLERPNAATPTAEKILFKAMRRVCDSQKPEYLVQAMSALSKLTSQSNAGLLNAGLAGLIEGQKGKALAKPDGAAALLNKLANHSNPESVRLGQQLGSVWGDANAIRGLAAIVQNTTAAPTARIEAIRGLRQHKTDMSRETLATVLAREKSDSILQEALLALGEVGGDSVAGIVLNSYRSFSTQVRRVAIEVLASRSFWCRQLLDAVDKKEISASEFPTPVLRSLFNHTNPNIKEKAIKTIGRYRDPEADKMQLLQQKRKVVLTGKPNLDNGKSLAQKNCLICHKFHGQGGEVGPDLTGVGRSTLDALLANIIAPNQIVGQGYENVEIETKDGRSISGRIVENTNTRIKVLSAGPREEIVSKSEIARQRVSELSVMPEGLEQIPDNDFRDLVWYILNPPEDKRPMTPELRKELVGD